MNKTNPKQCFTINRVFGFALFGGEGAKKMPLQNSDMDLNLHTFIPYHKLVLNFDPIKGNALLDNRF